MSVPTYPFDFPTLTPKRVALAVCFVLVIVTIGYFWACFSSVNNSESSVTTLNVTQAVLQFNDSMISGRFAIEASVIGDPQVITTPNFADLYIEMEINGTKEAITVATSGQIDFHLGKNPSLLFNLNSSGVGLTEPKANLVKQMAERGLWVYAHGVFQTSQRASSLPWPTRKSRARFHCKLAFMPIGGGSKGVLGVRLAYQFCWAGDSIVQLN